MDYKTSGVDIEAGYRSVELMKKYVKETMRPEVLGGLGGFSGAFSLAKIKEITIDSALNDATTLPKPILNKLLDKAIGEKVWSDEDINNFEEHKSNMNYVWNFLSDAAKVQLGELAMADKASITAEKMFGGLVEGRVSKQLKEICLLDQTYVKAEDGKQSVAKYLESVSKDLKITKMIRFEVGEGMEKKQEDFAAEVAAQMNA